ncbi:MAG: hypothetical protein PVI23_11090 [Maricaulaceae bacterium]|jgi:hypothetical protein
MYDALLTTHISAGSLALAAMLVPLLAPKGGRIHRSGGWVFVAAMAAVSASALIMSVWILLLTPATVNGLRLLELTFIGANAVWIGLRALRTKTRTSRSRNPLDLGMPLVLVVVSVGVVSAGARLSEQTLLGLGGTGFLLGAVHLRYWLRPPTSRMHWWFRHMSGMLFACIAATTAATTNFSKFGIWPGTTAAIAIVASVGIPGMLIWIGYYKRRFRSAEHASEQIAAAE